MDQNQELSGYERKRQEREEKDRERAKVKRTRSIKTYAVGAVLLLLAAGGMAMLIRSAGKRTKEQSLALRSTHFEDKGRTHMENVKREDFDSVPPTSGPHYASQTNWGMHKEPIPEGYQVHNLEHGGILMQ